MTFEKALDVAETLSTEVFCRTMRNGADVRTANKAAEEKYRAVLALFRSLARKEKAHHDIRTN